MYTRKTPDNLWWNLSEWFVSLDVKCWAVEKCLITKHCSGLNEFNERFSYLLICEMLNLNKGSLTKSYALLIVEHLARIPGKYRWSKDFIPIHSIPELNQLNSILTLGEPIFSRPYSRVHHSINSTDLSLLISLLDQTIYYLTKLCDWSSLANWSPVLDGCLMS